MKSNKGFTLIELLVVIAIIGILSSVVLASLNTARRRGEDAAKQANLNNIRAQAELYYDGAGDGSYSGVCLSDSTVVNAVEAAGATCRDEVTEGVTGWAAFVLLSDGDTYCVDHTGNSVKGLNTTGVTGTCVTPTP